METMEEGVGSLWEYQEDADDLWHRLLCTTLELEATRTKSEQVMRTNQEKIQQLLLLLQQTSQQRDEAREQFQTLLNKFFLVESNYPLTTVCNSNITSSSDSLSSTPQKLQPYVSSSGHRSNLIPLKASTIVDDLLIANRRPLPEKGNLLKAVMEAGPLLKTLLMTGPLPQWRNPPPIHQHQVPTIGFSGNIRNRGGGFVNYHRQFDDDTVGGSHLFLSDLNWNSDNVSGLDVVRKRPLQTPTVGVDDFQDSSVKRLKFYSED